MSKIINAAREAVEIAKGNMSAARVTWFMEFEHGKSAKIVVEGPFDREVIDAMKDYIARHESRLPVSNGERRDG